MKYIIKFFASLLDFFKLAFCENGEPSSKRVLAGILIFCVAFCTAWCGIKEGMTENLKAVIEVEVVSACALCGVSTVTSIWKDNTPKQDNDETEA